jgi:hypothetical protein
MRARKEEIVATSECNCEPGIYAPCPVHGAVAGYVDPEKLPAIIDRVLEYVRSAGVTGARASDVAIALRIADDHAATALSKLARRKWIVRASRGLYQATQRDEVRGENNPNVIAAWRRLAQVALVSERADIVVMRELARAVLDLSGGGRT